MSEPNPQHSPERAEHDKYWRVFHATPDYATFSRLETGVFIDVNPGFEKMIGYRRDEAIGRSSANINLWVDLEDRRTMVARLRNGGKMSFTTRMRTRSGEQILVEASMASFEMNGEMLLVAVVRDITARRREEEELQQYRTQLEKLVEQRTVELQQALLRVNELAVHDDLTGVGNRRDMNNQLQIERQLFDRIELPVCIAILDLDGLKPVNDAFGHAVGDEVIKAFAAILQGEMRITDYLGRYGGDEFVLLLRGTSSEAAMALLQRICVAVEKYHWAGIAPGVALTTSIGLASFNASESADATFNRADKALYKAKVGGRNQIVVARDPE
jgi:diguanylate cyclase (GGDEF)-like protein/PAS domain S-box-containing protein